MPGRLICFVCGSPGAETTLRVRQHDREPYFPFLLQHDPPKGARLPNTEGVIDSCVVCYMFLTQQWDSYERSKTPAVKRLYWLKRSDNGNFTGAEMRIQGEYIAQVMGLQYPPGVEERHSPDNVSTHERHEREFSNHGNNSSMMIYNPPSNNREREPPREREYTTPQGHHGKPSALDLSTPKKKCEDTKPGTDNSNSVCYVCGQLFTFSGDNILNALYQGNAEPFFPILERITPSPGADYMSRGGQVKTCTKCKNTLLQQWQAFEMSGTPITHRDFTLPRESEVAVRKTEIKSEDNYANSSSASSYYCYICGSSYITDHVRLLNTLPPKRVAASAIFFPFVRDLKRPPNAEPLRSDGTVIVCLKCYSHLGYQWEMQESEGVPVYNRQYSLHFLSQKSSPREQPTKEVTSRRRDSTSERIEPLNIRISSASPMQPNTTSGNNYPQGLLAIAAQNQNEDGERQMSRSSSLSSSPVKGYDTHIDSRLSAVTDPITSTSSKTVPHPLQQATEIPKKICFLCGEKCIIHKMRPLCSYPPRHEGKHTNSQVEPFFPFLANCTAAPGADPLAEDGSVIACKLCYHSILRQWSEYEHSRNPADSNRWLRKYNLPNHVCYVCAVENERKFMRTIAVENFNFLKEHKAPRGALVIDEGQRVAVCKSCAYSLMQQFSEFERMGVPHQLRKFNWIQKSSTVDSGNEGSQDTEQDPDSRKSSFSRGGGGGGQNDDSSSQGPLGSGKPPPLNMISPAAGSKHQRNTATVSPLHHVTSPTNGVNSLGANASLNASCTSSFAAALRKLANQAKDPEEGPVKTASSTSPRDTAPKVGPPPLMYTSTTLTSPPVVTIAPTQSHTNLLASDSRPTLERLHSNSSMFESVGKMDRPHSSASREEDRASSRDNMSQSARRLTPHSTPGAVSPMSGRDETPARGFQPYRPGDDMRPPLTSSALALDHAAAAAAAAYSYPTAFLPPHAFPHPAFRFDDPLLLERYRMMQSPYLPYPQGIMPHPGLHPLLAASGGRYPHDIFPPQFPQFSQQGRMSDHRSPSMLSERQRMEEEKQREIEREKDRDREREREKDREIAVQRERQKALEREVEKQRDRDRLPREPRDESSKDKQEGSLSAKFGSIIQGTPKGLGIADRYPRVSSSSLTTSLGRKDDRRSSKDEYTFPGTHSRPSSSRSSTDDPEKRFSLVNPLRESGKSRPPPLISPRSDGHQRSSGSSKHNDSGLFRPFDSQQINGYDSHNSGRRDRESSLAYKAETDDNKYSSSDRHNLDKKSSSSSAVHSFANHLSKLEADAQILSHSRDGSHSVPTSSFSTPLNVPSYNSALLQSGLHRGDNSGFRRGENPDISKSSSSKESQLCVSKLDLEARRKSESQGEPTFCSDSECEGSDIDDQDKNLLISSGPPLKLDTSPKKIKLLSELGLTTFSNKKDADFEKWRKRRRRMKERSVSPVSVESGPPTPLKTQYRPSEICLEPDYKQKCQFLSQNLFLEPVPSEHKKANEVIKKACEEEKKRRHSIHTSASDGNLCQKASSSDGALSLTSGVKRKLEDDVFSPSQIDSDITTDKRLNLHYRDMGSSHIGRSVSATALDSCDKNKPESNSTYLKRPNAFSKSFVQEFHESVLQTTRQKEMKRLKGEGQRHSLSDASPTTPTRHMLPWYPMTVDTWPGVDGVMESYHRHQHGEKMERQLLLERHRKLREENSRLNTQMAQLHQRREDVLMNKRQLEELRCYNQERIDLLKTSIRKLK